MRKLILTTIMITCICAVTGFADQDKLERFKEKLIEADVVQLPILKKVFPGVVFKEIISGMNGSALIG